MLRRRLIFVYLSFADLGGKVFLSKIKCGECGSVLEWNHALQQLHVGDRWEVYIPAEMGYGKFSQPGIPGGSTLIFDIELLAIN